MCEEGTTLKEEEIELDEREREREREQLSLSLPLFPVIGDSVKNAHEQFLGTDVPRRAITSVTSPPPSLPLGPPVVRSLPPGGVFPCARVYIYMCVCVAAAPGSRGENTALSFYPTPPKVAAITLARVNTRN